MAEEKLLGEEAIDYVDVRYVESMRDGEVHFWAAGAPAEGEWCFLARAEFLAELEVAARAVVEQDETRQIFVRCAALMGVEWNDGQMIPLLEAQDRNGRELMRKAPDMAQADVEDLRRMRHEAGDELSQN